MKSAPSLYSCVSILILQPSHPPSRYPAAHWAIAVFMGAISRLSTRLRIVPLNTVSSKEGSYEVLNLPIATYTLTFIVD
jgi:hypothetical protein